MDPHGALKMKKGWKNFIRGGVIPLPQVTQFLEGATFIRERRGGGSGGLDSNYELLIDGREFVQLFLSLSCICLYLFF